MADRLLEALMKIHYQNVQRAVYFRLHPCHAQRMKEPGVQLVTTHVSTGAGGRTRSDLTDSIKTLHNSCKAVDEAAASAES